MPLAWKVVRLGGLGRMPQLQVAVVSVQARRPLGQLQEQQAWPVGCLQLVQPRLEQPQLRQAPAVQLEQARLVQPQVQGAFALSEK